MSTSNIARCLYTTYKSEGDLTAEKVEILGVSVSGYRNVKAPILSFKVSRDSHWCDYTRMSCLWPLGILSDSKLSTSNFAHGVLPLRVPVPHL